jgi:hypothetical protein
MYLFQCFGRAAAHTKKAARTYGAEAAFFVACVGLFAVRFAHTCTLRAWYASAPPPRRYYPSRKRAFGANEKLL